MKIIQISKCVSATPKLIWYGSRTDLQTEFKKFNSVNLVRKNLVSMHIIHNTAFTRFFDSLQ